jgi:Dolichyl-phosphate-mannose-protein mannosyltransferase
MTNARLADQRNELTDDQRPITRATVLKLFVLIAVVSFILRIFYAGHLYEDDGLWFAAAEELVRGKALYREIYFDKPPGLALVYALLFWVSGAHILTIRLFTIAYSVAISAVLYLFGAWLYDKRIGLLAAAMFAVFSTTYAIGHIQSLSTDFLMALPYTAGAYLLVRSREDSRQSKRDRAQRARFAAAGGALVGLAFQTNPKGIFDLFFFALFLIATHGWSISDRKLWRRATAGAQLGGLAQIGDSEPNSSIHYSVRAPVLFFMAVVGFAGVSLCFLAYVAGTLSLSAYWHYVWEWGARYAEYYPASVVMASAVRYTAGYFALNDVLLITLVFVVTATIAHMRRRASSKRTQSDPGGSADHLPKSPVTADRMFESDVTLLIWFAVSYAGVTVGGRFYSHYFFQILPCLCLIGGRGLSGILQKLQRRGVILRRVVITLLLLGFVFTLVRFHGRGVLLAIDWARGADNILSAKWYHEIRNREERRVAAVVRDLPDGADAADHIGLEGIRAGGPRTRAADGPGDYLFVWGYRPELYYWSGLLPASRYLSAQPLTGVPADVQYTNGEHRSILKDSSTASAREQLIRDLNQTQPKYIVDELGFFNGDLAILKYEELHSVMDNYKPIGATGRLLIYLRKDLTKKHLLRHETAPR